MWKSLEYSCVAELGSLHLLKAVRDLREPASRWKGQQVRASAERYTFSYKSRMRARPNGRPHDRAMSSTRIGGFAMTIPIISVAVGSMGYAAWRINWPALVQSFLTGPGRTSRLLLLFFIIFNWKTLPLAWTVCELLPLPSHPLNDTDLLDPTVSHHLRHALPHGLPQITKARSPRALQTHDLRNQSPYS